MCRNSAHPFDCLKKTPHGWGFQKAFAMPSLNLAESLPLMREVAKIYLIFDGGRETIRANSLPQSRCSRDSPLVRGGLRLANDRICGGGAQYASER